MFADCFGFGDVFTDTQDVPVAKPSLTYAQIKSLCFNDDEIQTRRKAYKFLRSALTSEVDRGILLRAHSPTEAWTDLQTWHNPKSIAAPQAFHGRFQTYSMKPGQNPLISFTDLEEMAAQLAQQEFSMALNQALIRDRKADLLQRTATGPGANPPGDPFKV